MGRKSKYTVEQKLKAVEKYLSGKESATDIAISLGMTHYGQSVIFQWVGKYKTNGTEAFSSRPKNNSYSKEFKDTVVQEYLSGQGSYEDLALKHNIPSTTQISMWVSRYNNRLENRDYNLGSEIVMEAKRKTTLEERIEIAKECLVNGKNFAQTARKHGCSYHQVRSWTLKYMEGGDDALKDNRGRKKPEEQLNEIEKLKRENEQLKRKAKFLEMENELLKKADEWERRVITDWQFQNEPEE